MSDYIDVAWEVIMNGTIRILKDDMPSRFSSRRELMAWIMDYVHEEISDDLDFEIENMGEIGSFVDEFIKERDSVSEEK